jgi:hypothetical protein
MGSTQGATSSTLEGAFLECLVVLFLSVSQFMEDDLWECTMKPEAGGAKAREEVTSSKAFSVKNEVKNVADAVDGLVANMRPEHTKAVAGEDRAAVAGDRGSAVGIVSRPTKTKRKRSCSTETV